MQNQIFEFLNSAYSVFSLFLQSNIYKQILQFSIEYVKFYNYSLTLLVQYVNKATTFVKSLKKEDKDDLLFFAAVFYVLETLYFYIFASHEK